MKLARIFVRGASETLTFRAKRWVIFFFLSFGVCLGSWLVYLAIVPKYEAAVAVGICPGSPNSPTNLSERYQMQILRDAATSECVTNQIVEAYGTRIFPRSIDDLITLMQSIVPRGVRMEGEVLYYFKVRGLSREKVISVANAAARQAQDRIREIDYQNFRIILSRLSESELSLLRAQGGSGCRLSGPPLQIWKISNDAARIWFTPWPTDWLKIFSASGLLTVVFGLCVVRTGKVSFEENQRENRIAGMSA